MHRRNQIGTEVTRPHQRFARIMSFLLWLAVVSLITPCVRTAVAADQVTVGTYVNQISWIDLRTNQFAVDFTLWFLWKNDKLKPLDTFELVNGHLSAKTGIVTKTVDGMNYAACRVVATITNAWDLRRFPLDSHVLAVEIEDTDTASGGMVYVADADHTGIDPAVQVPGWVVSRVWPAVSEHSREVNHGDTSLPGHTEAVYSRFVASTEIVRPGYVRVVKLFAGLFAAFVLAWLAFFVRPKDAVPRMALSVGAAFLAGAGNMAVMSVVPDTNVVTMADRMIFLSFGAVCASCLASVVSLILLYHGKEVVRQRVDRGAGFAFPALYLVLLFFWVL